MQVGLDANDKHKVARRTEDHAREGGRAAGTWDSKGSVTHARTWDIEDGSC